MTTITENTVQFGWLPSSPEKRNLHSSTYGFNIFLPFVAAGAVNVELKRHPSFIKDFDQDGMNACVGASTAKGMATINLPQLGPQAYKWKEHYRKACEIDKDPSTSYERDIGTYIWAGMDVLRLYGAWLKDQFELELGLDKYYWCSGSGVVDQMRTAVSLGRPLQVGMPWPEAGLTPVRDQAAGIWRFPGRAKWKKFVGGHAILWPAAMDQYQAFGLSNTWGEAGYPDLVYIDYRDAEYLMGELNAECAVGIDRAFTPPEPPPIAKPVTATVTINGMKYELVQK